MFTPFSPKTAAVVQAQHQPRQTDRIHARASVEFCAAHLASPTLPGTRNITCVPSRLVRLSTFWACCFGGLFAVAAVGAPIFQPGVPLNVTPRQTPQIITHSQSFMRSSSSRPYIRRVEGTVWRLKIVPVSLYFNLIQNAPGAVGMASKELQWRQKAAIQGNTHAS